MKKILFIFGLIMIMVLAYGCGPKPEPVVEEEPIAVVDTATPPPPPPVTTPPPPPPEVKETDFNVIQFDFDKYNVRPDQMTLLNANVALLKKNPDMVIKIEGHCDERGTTEYNLALGDRRAVAVKTYLMDAGIAEERISTISYGEERPVDLGHTESAWDKNRRAEFRIVKK